EQPASATSERSAKTPRAPRARTSAAERLEREHAELAALHDEVVHAAVEDVPVAHDVGADSHVDRAAIDERRLDLGHAAVAHLPELTDLVRGGVQGERRARSLS